MLRRTSSDLKSDIVNLFSLLKTTYHCIKFDFSHLLMQKRHLWLLLLPRESTICGMSGRSEEGGRENARVFVGLFASFKDTAPSKQLHSYRHFPLTPRRDPRAAWKYTAFRTAILHSQLRSGSSLPKGMAWMTGYFPFSLCIVTLTLM